MNIREMTDSELYRLGIEVLASKLGTVGVHRFLNLCQPCTGDYSVERHEWLDNLPDMDTLIEQIRQASKDAEAERNRISKLKTYISKNGKPLTTRIQKISDEDLHKLGLEALVDKLSIAGMPRFIRLCSQKTGIYAIEPDKLPGLDIEGIIQEAIRKKHPRGDRESPLSCNDREGDEKSRRSG